MDSIGQYLKTKREEQNLSIDQISHSTRLKTYSLKQIEDDDFAAISDVGYIKAMVITYCRAVNGNEEIVKNKLDKLFNKPTEPPIKIITAKNVKPVIFSLNIFYFFFLGVLAILLTIALSAIYKKGTFSLNDIKNQFAAIEKRVTPKNTLEDLEPDSLWLYQRDIFLSINNTLIDDINPNEDLFKPDSMTPKKEIAAIKSRRYIYDNKDYVSEMIFQNKFSPLNPNID